MNGRYDTQHNDIQYNDSAKALVNDTQHSNALPCAEYRYAECRVLFAIMLMAIMLNVVMLNAE